MSITIPISYGPTIPITFGPTDTRPTDGGGGSEIVDVIILIGQSQQRGRGLLADAPSELQAPLDGVFIYNDSANEWQTLEGGVNNDALNLSTFGPELSAGYFIKESSGKDLYIIKYAQDNTILNDDNLAISWNPSGGVVYNAAITRIDEALAALVDDGKQANIRAISWNQGGSDRFSGREAFYQANLQALLDALIAKYSSNWKFIIHGLMPYTSPAGTEPTIKAAQVSVALANANAVYVSSRDIELLGDGIHQDHRGSISLGLLISEQLNSVALPYSLGLRAQVDPSNNATIVQSGGVLTSITDTVNAIQWDNVNSVEVSTGGFTGTQSLFYTASQSDHAKAGEVPALDFAPSVDNFSFQVVTDIPVGEQGAVYSKAGSTSVRQYYAYAQNNHMNYVIGGTNQLGSIDMTGEANISTLSAFGSGYDSYINKDLDISSPSIGTTTTDFDIMFGARKSGTLNSDGPAFLLDGYIGEWLAYGMELPKVLRENNVDYLSTKWNVAQPFDPSQVSGNLIWLDATDSDTITDISGGVLAWDDKSGNNRCAAQTTSTSRPTTNTLTINGNNVLDFDGTSDYLQIPDFVYNTNGLHIFMVLRFDGVGIEEHFLNHYNTGGNNRGWDFYKLSSDDYRVVMSRDGTFTNVVTLTGTTIDPVTGAQIIELTFEPNDISFFQNNTALAESGTQNITDFYDAAAPINIGCRLVSNNPNGYFDGAIGEIILYNNIVGTSDRSSILSYLSGKWGISI